MEKARIYLCAIVFLSVLSLQDAAADAPIDKQPDGKDAAQLAKQLWGEFFSADARFRQEGIFRERLAEPLSISYQTSYERQFSYPFKSKSRLQNGHRCNR